MEVQLALFFCDHFMGYKNTFKAAIIDKPDYTVELITDANVGILLSQVGWRE